jgi:hypothetical protein
VLCGGAAASADPALDRRHLIEAVKADCMEEKGFEYVPYARPERQKSDEERRRAAGDYEAMRVHRAFFGFGVFSAYIHGRDPEEPAADPNDEISSTLEGDRLTAYSQVRDACMAGAVERVVGLEVKSAIDYHRKVEDATDRALTSALNDDPRLVELAAAMAGCLRGRGHAVEDATPVALSTRGVDAFAGEETRVTLGDGGVPPATEGATFIMLARKTLTYEEAMPYLDKEIKAALDDLECGRDFYPAYRPRENAIEQRVHDRYGLTPFPGGSEDP